MNTKIAWLGVLAALVACEVEQEQGAPPSDVGSSLGTWTIGYTELVNDCGSEGMLFPVGPAPVDIARGTDEVTLSAEGVEPRTYLVDGSRWVRERTGSLGDCDGSLHEVWQVHRLTRTRLSATYEAELELSDRCDLPMVHSCRVRYSVWGKIR